MRERVETLIVGGGQAGLAMSHCLAALGREHLVLERGRVGERWRSERWDSLTLLTPNWLTRLPGYGPPADDQDGFLPLAGVVRFIEEYAARDRPPLRCGVGVARLGRDEATGRYRAETDAGDTYLADRVVVATGPYGRPRVPAWAAAVPPDILQLTANRYRNPAQVPPGAVLVVGSGASGCQIAEELTAAGHTVYLSLGRCGRRRRRYRGRDAIWWGYTMGLYGHAADAVPPAARGDYRGQYTGVGGGRDLDYGRLVAAGDVLLGRLEGGADGVLAVADDLAAALADWDAGRVAFEAQVDAYIAACNLDAPPAAPAAPPPTVAAPIRRLDLRAAGIGAVIWAVGYDYDYDWLAVPVLDDLGRPVHRRGLTASPGLAFLGLPWQSAFKSAFIYGVGDDAAWLAERFDAGHLSPVDAS